MQIVINIDDDLYTRLFDDGNEYVMDMRRACVAIRKGTPLNNMLSEIKQEFIEIYPKNYAGDIEAGGCSCVFSLNKVLDIIDKYKGESEVQDADSN